MDITVNGDGEVLPWEEEEARSIVLCYLNGCEKKVYPNSYWCSRSHQEEWQKTQYGESGYQRGPKSVEQIQKQIGRMKHKAQQLKLL